ncbi:MAG TPA: hypothetical protein VM529_20315 [Gemmata sp.]|nr:hypothetical protein [Gemmata sp.]
MNRFAVSGVCLLCGVLVLSGGLFGQEKKQDVKNEEPPAKIKGVLPQGWAKIGLSEDQVQTVYRINQKYDTEIRKLEAKIAELKSSRDKERKGVLTPEQKKRLEDILLGKGE